MPTTEAALAAHDQHHAGHQHEQKQQIQVPHAPEPAEFEEERQTAQQREEKPDFRFQTKVGYERTPHGNLVSPIQTEWVRPQSWHNALSAARCSASFLLRPQAGAWRWRPISAVILKHFEWSGPFSSSSR